MDITTGSVSLKSKVKPPTPSPSLHRDPISRGPHQTPQTTIHTLKTMVILSNSFPGQIRLFPPLLLRLLRYCHCFSLLVTCRNRWTSVFYIFCRIHPSVRPSFRPSVRRSVLEYLSNRSLDSSNFLHEGPAHYCNKSDTARFLKKNLVSEKMGVKPPFLAIFEVFCLFLRNRPLKFFNFSY